jgi:four helix bundle protein
MPAIFDHEKLKVYQASIQFVKWVQQTMGKVPKGPAVYNQLDRASTSIALNIAEGNGKYSPKDRCRYFDIARGSALECAAALDVMVARELLEAEKIVDGKALLQQIVSMLVGLIKSHSEDRVYETQTGYGEQQERDSI